jgi:hypothetical protein
VPEGTVSPTQVQIVSGTPGAVIRYTTNGADPTESDPVLASGSAVTVDHTLTLKARAFRSGFTTSAVKTANYTVAATGPIELLIDSAGPAVDQVTALDSFLLMRDPFPVINLQTLFNPGSDHNTRLMVFARNVTLNPGETAATVIVNLVDANSQVHDVPADSFRIQIWSRSRSDYQTAWRSAPARFASSWSHARATREPSASNPSHHQKGHGFHGFNQDFIREIRGLFVVAIAI